MRRLKRSWGWEEVLVEAPTYCLKRLIRRAGTAGGLQAHLKYESHFLVHGCMDLTLKQGLRLITVRKHPGDYWHVPPGTIHQERAVTPCVILEAGEPTFGDRIRHDQGEPGRDPLPTLTPDRAQKLARRLQARLEARGRAIVALAPIAVPGGDFESSKSKCLKTQKERKERK